MLSLGSSLLFVILLSTVNVGSSGAPPKLIPGYQSYFLVKIGGRFKLNCPVEFDPTDFVTFFNWGKDDASLDSAPNTGLEYQLQSNKRILEIDDATLRHSGNYFCEGTNGFGMEKGVFTVLVYDPNMRNSQCTEYNKRNELPSGAPCFPDGHADEVIQAIVGSTVVMNCSAVGVPPPSFKWLKADKRIDWIVSAQGTTTSQLQLHNVQKGYEGGYTCNAFNEFGSVTARYSLTVSEKYEPAHILGPRPMNITVRVGESANFVCRIRAKGMPTVRWGKRITKELKLYYERIKKETLVYLDELFVVLDPNQVEAQQENDPNKLGTYSIELKIPNVSSASAGKYVCMVIGPKGEIDQKAAYLYVTPESPGIADNNNYLILYISVPLAIFIVCFFVMIFCIISRKCALRNGQRRNGTAQRYALKGQIMTAPTATQFEHYPSFSTQEGYMPVPGDINYLQQQQQHQLAQTQHQQQQQLLHDGTPSSSAASSWVGARSQYTHQVSLPHMNSQAGSFNSVPSHHNGQVLGNSYPA